MSSTYTDLVLLREKVVGWLGEMELSVTDMKNFPSDADSPEVLSLKKLQHCNYFLLIIGHRYGVPPEGYDKSITHLEYETAYRMLSAGQLENIFVFLATDEFSPSSPDAPLPPDVEGPLLRKKLIEFRKIVSRHTTRSFKNESELEKAIYHTLLHAAKANFQQHGNEYTFFDKPSQIKHILEADPESKQAKIDAAMHKIAEAFKPNFELKYNAEDMSMQPILKRIQDVLDGCVSHIAFDKNREFEGRIDRWGIRHVIFRVDTVIKLMSVIKNPDDLRNIGVNIGENASHDLFENVLSRQGKSLPYSIGAFVDLLNYWDSSGGWGKLEFQREDLEGTSGKWVLTTKNNFLLGDTTKDNQEQSRFLSPDHLYKFWEGYISGALSHALVNLNRSFSELPKEEKKKVKFPAYSKVKDVKRIPDEEPNVDFFEVSFEIHPQGWALGAIARIKYDYNNKEDPDDKNSILNKLAGLIDNLKVHDEKVYQDSLRNMNEEERGILEKIARHRYADINVPVLACIELVNFLIQSFLKF